MRAICKVCVIKEDCPYIKKGRVGDCIDVQTTDYGYDEAVEKACKWIVNHNGDNSIAEEFRKAMEEHL